MTKKSNNTDACNRMADKWLVLLDGKPAGYPESFKFDTRKEAHKKAQKLGHQTGGGADVVVMRESEYEKSSKITE